MLFLKIAFDIDGVLCEIDIATHRILDNITDVTIYNSVEEYYYKERKPLLDARLFLSEKDEMYIITSRPEHLRWITEKWVKQYFPNAKLIIINQNLLKGNTKKAVKDYCKTKVEMKAEVINKLEIDVYFDDESEALQHFRELCPDCKIIKYGGRIEDGE